MKLPKAPNHICPGGEPEDCACGHSWDNHHHGCIMNENYPTEDHKNGAHTGVRAQECEAEQFEGSPTRGPDSCFCGNWHLRHKEGVICEWCRKGSYYD